MARYFNGIYRGATDRHDSLSSGNWSFRPSGEFPCRFGNHGFDLFAQHSSNFSGLNVIVSRLESVTLVAMETTPQLAHWVASARRAVAFTGAGISTESGIPDFCSPGGVWSRHKPVYYDEFVASRAARARYWKARLEMYREFASAKPNDGHLALAHWESVGKLRGVITQNIDGLHQLAGSRAVIELHGTARVVACIRCGRECPPEEIHERIESGDEAPDCDDCGSPLKSRTISFGQAMPAKEMAEAEAWASEADLMLAIGSSLVVEPAASIPRIARQCGARLVIVNATETPLDDMADLLIRDSIGPTLRTVRDHLDGSRQRSAT